MTALEFYIEGLKVKGFSDEKIKELTEHRDLPWLQFAEDYYNKQLNLSDVGKCNGVKDPNIIKTYMLIKNKYGLTDVWCEGICLGKALDTNGINELNL